jgi:four helix bundle protein
MSFEKLRVYQAAELLDSEAKKLIASIPRGFSEDVGHLNRAVGSLLYNVPEAYGSEHNGRKRYHLEVARGSVDEARSALRRLARDGALTVKAIKRACALTSAIAKMLTAWMDNLPEG